MALLDELRYLLGDPPIVNTGSVDDEYLGLEDASLHEVFTASDREYAGPRGWTPPTNRIEDDGFAHVLVDEAQDLTPMQWRMVGRRGRGATWTIVGDLAQSSWPVPAEAAAAREDGAGRQAAATTSTSRPTTATPRRSTSSRRSTPQRVGLDADLPDAVRSTGVAPAELRVDDLESAVREQLGELAGSLEGTVGDRRAGARLGEVTRWVSSWPEYASETGAPDSRIVVLTGLDTKGLEFDGIVVVSRRRSRTRRRPARPRSTSSTPAPPSGWSPDLRRCRHCSMLIHPWDEATREEWQRVLAAADFGQLITAGHVDGFPVVVPTHFLYDGDSTVLLHLARPNPVWKALDADPHVVLALTGDYTYVEAEWNTEPGHRPGVRRAHVVLHRRAAALPRRGRRRPGREGRDPAPPSSTTSSRPTPSASHRRPDNESDRRQLPGIRGLRLHLEGVRAKMKYGGNKTPEHRREIADHLAERDGPMDSAARDHLLRRLDD